MKSNKLIVGIVLAAGLYYLLKRARKQPSVMPSPVNTTNSITPPLGVAPMDEVIVTPMEQVSDLSRQIQSCNANRISVRYMAGKTHYI